MSIESSSDVCRNVDPTLGAERRHFSCRVAFSIPQSIKLKPGEVRMIEPRRQLANIDAACGLPNRHIASSALRLSCCLAFWLIGGFSIAEGLCVKFSVCIEVIWF
ncbi:hypothetical protein [Mesorhizobium sp. L-2-11]|uniref:hypothetical protein n=1 Tax=Mesorhizobium sp. L-2-11 TaxID=2744521 RepID=UPI001928A805|nr:hypothetical protein [Mesorhizobium sp. L-2-11]